MMILVCDFFRRKWGAFWDHFEWPSKNPRALTAFLSWENPQRWVTPTLLMARAVILKLCCRRAIQKHILKLSIWASPPSTRMSFCQLPAIVPYRMATFGLFIWATMRWWGPLARRLSLAPKLPRSHSFVLILQY